MFALPRGVHDDTDDRQEFTHDDTDATTRSHWRDDARRQPGRLARAARRSGTVHAQPVAQGQAAFERAPLTRSNTSPGGRARWSATNVSRAGSSRCGPRASASSTRWCAPTRDRQLRRRTARPGPRANDDRSRSDERLSADEIAASAPRWADRPVDLSCRRASTPTPPRSVRRCSSRRLSGPRPSSSAPARCRPDLGAMRGGKEVDIDGRGSGHADTLADLAQEPRRPGPAPRHRHRHRRVARSGTSPRRPRSPPSATACAISTCAIAPQWARPAGTCRLGEGAGKLERVLRRARATQPAPARR